MGTLESAGERAIAPAPAIRVLGPVSVLDAEGCLVPVRGQAGLLLALLAEAFPRPVAVGQLIDAVWPHNPTSTAPTGLRVAVHRLRRVLDGRADVVHEGESYRLVAPLEQVDVRVFDAVVSEAEALIDPRPAAAAVNLRAALDLWRGRPFAPHDETSALQSAVDHLRARRRDVEELYVDALLASGRTDEAAATASAFAEAEPYRERRWAQLVTALYRSDRQREALQVARQACERLRDDLGIEPSETLVALEHDVLTQADSLLAPRSEPRNGGSVVAHLAGQRSTSVGQSFVGASVIGRHDLLEALGRSFEVQRCITLLGPAGIGKTTVAASFVNGLVDRRVIWVDCAVGSDELSVRLGTDLGISSLEGRGGDIFDELERRASVVVFDNAEECATQVRRLAAELLERVDGLRILITSRAPLSIEREHVVVVPPLEPQAALALLQQRAFGVAADDPQTQQDGWSELVEHLDHLPLCIELVAPLVRSGHVSSLLAGLRDGVGAVASLPDQRLADTIERSVAALSPEAAALHHRLSVFEGSFDLADVEAVCSLAQVEARALLQELATQSLVEADRDNRERYRQLFAVRRAARVGLTKLGADVTDAQTHGRHYETVALELPERVAGALERSAVDFVQPRRRDFAQSFRWLCDHDARRAMQMAVALWDYSFMRLDFEWYDLPRRSLAVEGATEHPIVVEAEAAAAFACWVTGDALQAELHLARSSAHARAHNVEPSLVALLVEANVAALSGDERRAIEAFVALFEHSERRGDDRQRSDVAVMMALGQVQLAQMGNAAASVERALELANRTRNPSSIAWANFGQGWVELVDDPTAASRSFLAAVRIARTVQNRWIEGMAVSALATSARLQGHHGHAVTMLAQVIGLWGRTRSLPQLARSVREAALVVDALGDEAAAARIVVQSHRLDPGHPLLPQDQERFDALERRVGLRSEPETDVAVWTSVGRELDRFGAASSVGHRV